MKSNPLDKNFSSSKNRTDDTLQKKWSLNPFPSPHDPGISFEGDPGRTSQSEAQDADINNIVARFHKTGVLPNLRGDGIYADFSDVQSYQDSLQIVIQAEAQFMGLDANTRRKFNNDPAEFLAFVDDPSNAQELVNMGLATAREPNPPSPAVSAPTEPGKGSKKGARQPEVPDEP